MFSFFISEKKAPRVEGEERGKQEKGKTSTSVRRDGLERGERLRTSRCDWSPFFSKAYSTNTISVTLCNACCYKFPSCPNITTTNRRTSPKAKHEHVNALSAVVVLSSLHKAPTQTHFRVHSLLYTLTAHAESIIYCERAQSTFGRFLWSSQQFYFTSHRVNIHLQLHSAIIKKKWEKIRKFSLIVCVTLISSARKPFRQFPAHNRHFRK